jgi:hypothetical protein
VNAQIQYGLPLPLTSIPSPPSSEVACFTAPVRCGRRRHDEIGHIELTNHRLRFHGTKDINIAWADVATIDRVEREMVISLRERRRQFRFRFHTSDEALHGTELARQLTDSPAAV